MPDATADAGFACPDLTTFCRLDELGLAVTGQRLDSRRAVLACRVVEADQWCRRCGCEGVPRDSVMRRLAHGLFWLTDGLALGALRELAAAGVRVPDDVAVIGFDNIGESRYSVPSLTTVDAGCSSRRSGSSSGSPPGWSRRTRLRKSVFPQGPTGCRSRSPAWFAASLSRFTSNGREFSRCESL